MRLNLFIILYLSGYLVFTTWAEFDTPFWDNVFWVWQNIAYGGVLAWGTLFSVLKNREKQKVKWVLLFSILMFVWQCISSIIGININYSPAVTVAFIVCVIVCSILTFKYDLRIFTKIKTK